METRLLMVTCGRPPLVSSTPLKESPFCPSLTENAVDKESFLLLHTCSESLRELIPLVGPRMKFLRNLKLLVSERENNTLPPRGSSSDTSMDSTCASLPSSSFSSSAGAPRVPSSTCASPDRSTFKNSKRKFDIKAILENHSGGEAIVNQMEGGLLSHRSRLQAVRILVSYLMQEYGDRPASDVKLAMAKEIVNQFPRLKDEDGEGHEAWYISAKGKHCATGYIEERLRNVRKRSKDRGAIVKPTRSSGETSLLSTVNLDFISAEDSAEEVSSMSTWLKHNREPASQVKTLMAKTAKARATFVREHPEEPVANILKEYPRLIDTPGMIEQDFRIILPEAADSLFLKWDKMHAGICDYAAKQNNWNQFLRLRTPSTDDEKKNLAVLVLPCIFPPCIHRVKGKTSRARIEDAIMSFVDFQQIGTSIPSYLESTKKGEPFVLLFGDPLSPEQIFVVVEKQAIQVSSFLKGIDVCFKLFYILDISYPWQCATTWEFFQKCVYQLGEGKGKSQTSGCVRTLRAYLTNAE